MIKLDKGIDKDKIVRNLGKKYKLVPHLERAFKDFEDAWEFRYEEKEHDQAWHPSGHCTEPPTLLYKIATGETDGFGEISTSLRKTFQVGHFWHQLLQYVVVNKLEMCRPEAVERVATKDWSAKKDQQPYHWVRGSGDLAPVETPSWKGLVDFKTMHAQAFKEARIPARFEAKYECQINIYMDLFDEDEAIILPINKDSGEFKEFLYERNQDLIDVIYEKWEFVSACVDAGEPPTDMDDEMFPLPLTGPISV
jgi:hypothetical protein